VYPPSSLWDVFLAQPCPCLLGLPQSDFTRPDGTRERGVPPNQSVKRCQAQGSFAVLSTQRSTARRIPVPHRTWSFVVAVVKNAAAFQTRLSTVELYYHATTRAWPVAAHGFVSERPHHRADATASTSRQSLTSGSPSSGTHDCWNVNAHARCANRCSPSSIG
jgi:hypothetical protein